MNKSISVVIPAYNEEENIVYAIESVLRAVKDVSNYEILVIDDGSKDNTYKVVEEFSKKNRKIKILHHKINKGFGSSMREGMEKAVKSYITGFPGDNDMSWESLRELIHKAEEADVVTSYMINPQARSILRRIISRAYVMGMNLLFGLNLRYYNGYFIVKRTVFRKIKIESEGFSVFAEIIIKLLKRNALIKEIPFKHIGRKHGKSKLVTLKSIVYTVKSTLELFYDVRFSKLY